MRTVIVLTGDRITVTEDIGHVIGRLRSERWCQFTLALIEYPISGGVGKEREAPVWVNSENVLTIYEDE